MQPIYVDGVEVQWVGFDSMNDQKMINYLVEENCTRKCPACHLLPKDHMRVWQCFDYIDETFLEAMCLSCLHFGLNLFDHLINKVGGNQDFKKDQCTGEINKQLKLDRIQRIKDAYWNHHIPGIRISYLLKGQGTTNTGVYIIYILIQF